MRSISLAVVLTAVAATAAACGSDGAATGDTLPVPDTASTAVSTTDTTTDTINDTTTATTTESLQVLPRPTDQSDASSARAALDAARMRWADRRPASYTIVTQSLCFCPMEPWTDTVVDGVVTAHDPASEESFADPGPRPMEVLFDSVQRAIDDGYVSLDLSFDPDTGALEQFFVDVDERMADEEYGVEVISLVALD